MTVEAARSVKFEQAETTSLRDCRAFGPVYVGRSTAIVERPPVVGEYFMGTNRRDVRLATRDFPAEAPRRILRQIPMPPPVPEHLGGWEAYDVIRESLESVIA